MDDLDLRPTEDRLRVGLRLRALQVDPPDRLADVLAEARTGGRRRRWGPLAAVAAVAAVVAGLWLTHPFPSSPGPTAPAASTSPTGGPSVTPTRTGTPSPVPSATATPTEGTAATAPLPVYLVAPEVAGAPDGRYGLRRSWLPTSSSAPEDRVRAAVEAVLAAPVPGVADPPWAGTMVTDLDIAPAAVRVALSRGPRSTGTAADDLALQAVGWTAQAVLGRGNLPVTVEADGRVLGVVTRPAADEWWSVLTDVWVTSPTSGSTLTSAAPVVVRGEASVFEAALQWALERDGAPVRAGQLTASAGAPARGTFTVPLGRLGAGTYTVRVWSVSPKDGAVDASDEVTFEVR